MANSDCLCFFPSLPPSPNCTKSFQDSKLSGFIFCQQPEKMFASKGPGQ